MNFDLDKLLQKGGEVADAVSKTAVDLAQKGKTQLDLVSAQNRLSKAQRQLGALVYSQARNGEENKPLVHKYIEAIAAIEKEIDELRSHPQPAQAASPAPEQPAEPAARVCPNCGKEVSEDAMFCSGCGAQL